MRWENKVFLIAYFLGNIFAKNCCNRIVYVKITASQRWDDFLRHSVVHNMFRFVIHSLLVTQASGVFRLNARPSTSRSTFIDYCCSSSAMRHDRVHLESHSSQYTLESTARWPCDKTHVQVACHSCTFISGSEHSNGRHEATMDAEQ